MYEILKRCLEGGGYTRADAEARIGYLVVIGQITPDQAEALRGVAEARADVPSAVEADVAEVKQVVEEAASLLAMIRPAAQIVAAEKYSDEQLVGAAALFDDWVAGTAYKAGTVIRHDGTLYRVQQAVTAQAHQQPGGAGMLAVYAPVQVQSPEDETAGKVLPWVSGEAGIKVGDRREYKGKVYEAIQAPGVNGWAPDTVPAIWMAV